MKLEELLKQNKPILYHCTELKNTYNKSKDLDILSKGLLGSRHLEDYNNNPNGDGYGGSYPQKETGKEDHISVWILNRKNCIGSIQEALTMIRSREITFILNPATEYTRVNNHDGVNFHENEGLVKAPIKINSENIESVVIGKKHIEDNYNNHSSIPSLNQIEDKIDNIKTELERRDIPIIETEKLDY